MVTSCSALRASPGQWINQPTRHSSIPMLDPFAVHHPHHSTNGMGVSRRSCSCSCRTLKSCRQQRHLECRLLVTPCHAWIVAMPCRSRVLSASCRSRVLSASIWSRTTVALLTTLARARTSYIVAYLCLVAYPLSHCRTVALSHCRISTVTLRLHTHHYGFSPRTRSRSGRFSAALLVGDTSAK
jgi:hypothetical protein